jgi:DNA ligase-4
LAAALQEEGIVVKAADSSWRCNDRGLSWLKIKADYVQNVDIDAVIIGAKFGTGRRGGGVSEYLLALAEAPHGGATEPCTFISFCM